MATPIRGNIGQVQGMATTRNTATLPEIFTTLRSNNTLLHTFESVQIRRQLLYAALTHFFIGLITILLTILLGATVTEAILAVWALFCGVVGFGVICVHRAQLTHNSSESVSFAKIWLHIYLGMTGLGAILAFATIIHGSVLLGMSVPFQNSGRPRSPADLQEFISSSFSVWFVILGASNIVIGFAAAAADLILVKKILITLRTHKTIIAGTLGEPVTDQPPSYLEVPPPRYSAHSDPICSLVLMDPVKTAAPVEAPPSYEIAVTQVPAIEPTPERTADTVRKAI